MTDKQMCKDCKYWELDPESVIYDELEYVCTAPVPECFRIDYVEPDWDETHGEDCKCFVRREE